MNNSNKLLDKYKGCLYGGAIGDALGYPIEFRSAEHIQTIYGKNGIQYYELFNGKAIISDDTQMTLFTAVGLLVGYTRLCLRGIMGEWQSYIELAYRDWLITQNEDSEATNPYCKSWLLNVEEMHNWRAPGNTCLSALKAEKCGSVSKPVNRSKGCGGVMRVAPVGLYLPKHGDDIVKIDQIAAEAAAITHGHPLGYIPAAALAHIIARCTFTDMKLEKIVAEAIETTALIYKDKQYVDDFINIMNKAICLSHQELDDLEAIRKIGQGWVAEETLAIAVYCSLKYQNDFVKAVTTSVNHDGDSDSTGAVTGNIIGAYLGKQHIPGKFIEPLELKEVISEIAVDLFEDCKMSEYGDYHDDKWYSKYCTGDYSI
ncbi:MAG: ADP-ribosylglycohydrolase family protein [Clostridiaceae bacterium]|nr:ADP-ribosylglycohydrolase family protein [Clostridiaceae bacterium]